MDIQVKIIKYVGLDKLSFFAIKIECQDWQQNRKNNLELGNFLCHQCKQENKTDR